MMVAYHPSYSIRQIKLLEKPLEEPSDNGNTSAAHVPEVRM
jgi:hypothetical protein